MSGEPCPASPPKPRLTLRVGITGKRAISGTTEKRIRQDLTGLLAALADFLVTCRAKHDVFASEPPLLRIVSGMAEGADQIAAEVALQRHQDEPKLGKDAIETRLAAILPFRQTEYEKDFEYDPNRPKGEQKRTEAGWEEAKKRFRSLLEDAAVESVMEIDDEALLASPDPNDRNQAYQKLRDVLLEHTDVLVAISDDVDGGPGGTVDVIRTAVRDGIPVIKLSTKKPDIHVMRAADPDAPDQTPKEDEEVKEVQGTPQRMLPANFSSVLGRMLEPPAARSGAHDAGHGGAPSGRARLENYFKEEFKPARFGWVFKAFRDAMNAWPRGSRRSRCRLAAIAFFRMVRNYSIDRPSDKLAALWPASKGDAPFVVDCCNKKFRRILAARYAWADTLAVRYADATRSSYILIAFLGALAVLIGLLALFPWDSWAVWAKIAVLIIEGGLLASAGWFLFLPAHHARWHERMVEYRAVAELLRHQRFVYAFGGADRLERTADRSWHEPDAWVGWYVRATLRELGFPTIVLSRPYRGRALAAFQEDEIKGQINYNASVAKQFETIDERLNTVIRSGWKLTVWVAFVGALVLLILYLIKVYHWYCYELAVCLLEWLKPSLSVIMAFVPALIAAVHGVRFQMDFNNTVDRDASTERELTQLDKRLIKSLDTGAQPGRLFCMAYVRSANEAMSADLAGWSNVYRGKSPEPP
jgi:hypothetical protein